MCSPCKKKTLMTVSYKIYLTYAAKAHIHQVASKHLGPSKRSPQYRESIILVKFSFKCPRKEPVSPDCFTVFLHK